jgi:hypothetical protein
MIELHYANSFNIKSFKRDLIYTRSIHLFHHHWYKKPFILQIDT